MILIKWPGLQKYQQGGKPTCAIVHPTQIRSSSTNTLRVLQTNLLQVRFSSNALAGGGERILNHPSLIRRTTLLSNVLGVIWLVRPGRFVPQVRSLSVLWEAQRALALGTGPLFTRAARPLPSHQSLSTACAG